MNTVSKQLHVNGCVCTERNKRKRNDLTTTNPVYRCEELEYDASLYDTITEQNDDAVVEVGMTNCNEYLEILSDECEKQGPELPRRKPRPESKPESQDRQCEGLNERTPDSEYLEILGDETDQDAEPQLPTSRQDAVSEDQDRDGEGPKEQNSDHPHFRSLGDETCGSDLQHTTAEDQVQDAVAQYRVATSADEDWKRRDQDEDISVQAGAPDDDDVSTSNGDDSISSSSVERRPSARDQTPRVIAGRCSETDSDNAADVIDSNVAITGR